MMVELSDGDEAQREQQDRTTAIEQRRADLLDVLREPSGRRALYHILVDLGAFGTVHGDRQAGAHAAGVDLIARIQAVGMRYWHAILTENEK